MAGADEREVTGKAARGAAWIMATGLLTRGLQTVGTLVLANRLGAKVAGEVATAAILTMTASTATLIGVPNYLVTRATDRSGAWHASLVMLVTGAAALILVLAFGRQLGAVFGAPDLVQYLPGFALATLLARVGIVPERLLQFQLRFRTASLARMAGDLVFLGVSVTLAYLGAGGHSIVLGNVARAFLSLALLMRACPASKWLTPCPIDRKRLADMWTYGVPIGISVILGFGARWWDNLLVSGLFGATMVGIYNQAYNLADIPATQVGEQVGDVLSPSFAQVEDDYRKRILLRAMGVLGLVVFPMAAGLGAVAQTLVATLLRSEWALAAPMLSILCALSVVRPIGWTIGSYLEATNRSQTLLWLSVLRLAGVFLGIGLLGHFFGPVIACYGVGIGYGLYAVGAVLALERVAKVPALGVVRSILPPLLACVPLVGGVLLARAGWHAMAAHVTMPRGVGLGLEVVVGALVYVGGAFLIAPSTVADFFAVCREIYARRKRAPVADTAVAA